MTEIWKDIEGYDGLYQISNKGRVKSLSRHIKSWSGSRKSKEKIMALAEDKQGYRFIRLCKNNKSKTHRVSKLVSIAFLGKKKEGMVIDHINGIRNDNSIENLEYVTQRENVARYHRIKKGEKLGIHYDKNKKLYSATFAVGKTRMTLGRYKSEEMAIIAYKAAFKVSEKFIIKERVL